MRKRLRMPSRILVLGATSGIAMAVCRALNGPRVEFFLVGRTLEKLESVAWDLRTRGAWAVTVRAVDLDETRLHGALLEEAVSVLGEIDLALIAHGVLGEQKAAEADYAAALRVLETNLLSPVSLITWLANYFEERKAGCLAVIGSVAGDRGRKSNYVYGSSKGGLEVFLSGVRNRIDRAGVQVLTVKPGFVATAMTAHLRQGPLFATPAQVARGIVRAIEWRRDVVYVNGFWRVAMFLIRGIPEWVFKGLDL